MSNELQESELDQVTGGADWTAPTTDRSKPGAPFQHPTPQPAPRQPPTYIDPDGDAWRRGNRKIPSQRF
jgi:hypothetical protein